MSMSSGLNNGARLVAIAVFAIGAAGCGGCGSDPKKVVGDAPEEQHIGQIFAVYVDFRNDHKRPPKGAEELKSHIQKMSPEQLSRMKITDKTGLFISPRDQQPYVVVVPKSPLGGIVIYEKIGVGGKHMAASSTGAFNDLDDKELKGALGQGD